jgi:ABC-type sulfate transport system permease subunit
MKGFPCLVQVFDERYDAAGKFEVASFAFFALVLILILSRPLSERQFRNLSPEHT